MNFVINCIILAKYKDAEEYYKKALELTNLSNSKVSRHAKTQILFGLSQIGVLTSSFDIVQNYLVEYIKLMSDDNTPPTLNFARARTFSLSLSLYMLIF